MNKKANKSPRQPSAATRECICQGIGPVVSDLLRRIGPPDEARQHFRAARVEILKGLRALVDKHLAQSSKPDRKGAKITVE